MFHRAFDTVGVSNALSSNGLSPNYQQASVYCLGGDKMNVAL